MHEKTAEALTQADQSLHSALTKKLRTHGLDLAWQKLWSDWVDVQAQMLYNFFHAQLNWALNLSCS